MVKTSQLNLRIRSKTFFVKYNPQKNLNLQDVKSYILSIFFIKSETAVKFFITNIKKTTIFLLLEFTEEKEIRNSKNQSKLSLNIENQLIEDIILPIKGCLLALIYLLQLNHISKNEDYITNFDNNLIMELSQNLISFDLMSETKLNEALNKSVTKQKEKLNSKNKKLIQLTDKQKNTILDKVMIGETELKKRHLIHRRLPIANGSYNDLKKKFNLPSGQ